MSKDHLTYYREQKISPVRQDITDLESHFRRRAGLYRQLGILPSFLAGKRVIEVGPGSGFNAIYTASLQPAQFLLLEGNPTVAQEVRQLFSRFPEFQPRIELVEVDLFDFVGEPHFDFVFCEGLLAGTPEPERMIERLASLVAPGGVLVVTSEDYVSKFAETLRRFFADLVSDPDDALSNRVTALMSVFSPHLSTLTGMSRRHDDWIVDNLINPASVGKLFSLADTISYLTAGFDFYASSPHFVTDWRWYKLLYHADNQYNGNAIERFWRNVHSFIDHRSTFPERCGEENRGLYNACREIRELTCRYEQGATTGVLQRVREVLDGIVRDTQEFSQDLSGAVAEARSYLRADGADSAGLVGSRKFGSLFGRGQQYSSFQKRL